MLVNFTLELLAEIKPWHSANGPPTLRWYSLTFGWYWLDLQGTEFFRYSDEILAYWARVDPPGAAAPYVDYQVARLHEDLLWMRPTVLEEVPSSLAARLHPREQWED